MATQLDELSVKFTADIAGLKTGLDKVEMAVLKVAATTERSSKKMASSFNSFGRFLKFDVLARYGSQLIRLETQQEQLAASIKDVADQANIGTQELQALRAVADNNSGSAAALDQAIVKLQRSMGQARSGAKELREVFAALGLDGLLDKGATTEEMFYGVASAVSKLKDDSQAAAVVTKIMGKTADELVTTLQLGGPAARQMAEQVKGIISNETIQKLDAANDRTKEFERRMNVAGSAAATVFVDITDGLAELDKQWGISTLVVEGYTKAVLGLRLAWAMWGPRPSGPPKLSKSGDDLLSGFNQKFKSKPAPDGITPNQGQIDSLFSSGGGADKIDKAADAAQRYAEAMSDLQFEIEQLARTEEDAAFQEELRNRLSAAGVTLASAQGQAIQDQVVALQAAKQASDAYLKGLEVDAFNANRALEELRREAEELARPWIEIADNFEESFADTFGAVISGAEDAEEAFRALGVEILEVIAKTLLLQAIQGATKAAFGDAGLGGALAGIVGGFAAGGTLNPGNAYQVHKNETIIPQVPMSVIPAGKGGGGSSFSYSPTIYAPGADASTLAQMRTMLAHQKQDILSMMPKVIKENTARGRF